MDTRELENRLLQLENTVRTLSNAKGVFASPKEPSSPYPWMQWFDQLNLVLKYWDWKAWKSWEVAKDYFMVDISNSIPNATWTQFTYSSPTTNNDYMKQTANQVTIEKPWKYLCILEIVWSSLATWNNERQIDILKNSNPIARNTVAPRPTWWSYNTVSAIVDCQKDDVLVVWGSQDSWVSLSMFWPSFFHVHWL